ncbi:unnamed protein product, partial [Polarella glacialis]
APVTPSLAPFGAIRMGELRAACTGRGISESGSRNDLLYRLTKQSAAAKLEPADVVGTRFTPTQIPTPSPFKTSTLTSQSAPLRPADSAFVAPAAQALQRPVSPAAAAKAAAAALQQFEQMKVKELKTLCRSRSLEVSKKRKVDLLSQLVCFARTQSEGRASRPQTAVTSKGSAPEAKDLAKKSMDELRVMCQKHGLPQKGPRYNLVVRLTAWLQSMDVQLPDACKDPASRAGLSTSMTSSPARTQSLPAPTTPQKPTSGAAAFPRSPGPLCTNNHVPEL